MLNSMEPKVISSQGHFIAVFTNETSYIGCYVDFMGSLVIYTRFLQSLIEIYSETLKKTLTAHRIPLQTERSKQIADSYTYILLGWLITLKSQSSSTIHNNLYKDKKLGVFAEFPQLLWFLE